MESLNNCIDTCWKKHGSNKPALIEWKCGCISNIDEKIKVLKLWLVFIMHLAFVIPIDKANRNIVFLGTPAVTWRVLWIKVWPSFQLKVFLGLPHFYFYFWETQHGVKGPCSVVRETARFFEAKIFLPQKWGKSARKRVFWIYWEIYLLIFSEFGL